MSNFGFGQLHLVNPYDVAFREARSAVRSQYILEHAEVFDSVAAAIADSSLVIGTTAAAGHRDLHAPLYRLEAAASLLRGHLAHSPAALLFGSEKFGLSNDDLSYCNWLLRIPTRAEHGAMNLGQAVAICLYELSRDPVAVTQHFDSAARASAEQYDRLTDLLLDLLARSGYTQDRTSHSTDLKIRRLLRRTTLPASDAETWLGILRQILWKIDQTDPGRDLN
jgi:TrmH family RNA methyltransferase